MKKKSHIGIIPARYESSRFLGKPLTLILGKPMFLHVYEQAKKCLLLDNVVLATDDIRIEDAAKKFNVPVVMTRNDHKTGTDRVLEAAQILGLKNDDIVINIQGDEPALDPSMLSDLIYPFENKSIDVTSLASYITKEEALSANRVKVARAENGKALYFSRALIPYNRDGENEKFLLHIGLYAFRMQVLEQFSQLPQSPLENREQLEQLRLLENGFNIHITVTEHASHGVDSPEDLENIIRIIQEKKS